ncbi:Dolichyl-phosphate-mannose-protein mannosyltransferase [Nitrosospira multiformis ATCC 25196]|uniref:Dolichyl-phosphate-mannose-protein mannosyltransferase n=1 Tax=Nitrosospira multiformis (strain ATCC 25196 / NCIMB 11849 / C 71) TaxID=323848 RepID=Q2YCD5_NITMU|nr:glycosyltransferase family 39 protein [Nitrosospira multiformis]ABB73586.1 Glycosyl transferase, family 39 [Nitrosospira multiformis ATCC 25196]SEF80742.1 Dolichyl-phosphate-mannose-protein mannosyltransferase [Nitrosospira multiformis ATCC 25196]
MNTLPDPESNIEGIHRFRRRHRIAAPLFQLLDSHVFLPACFILFVALRVALIFFVPVEMTSDASWYFNRAVGIASGGGYSEAGYPTAYWPVGYPGFLGILFYLFGRDQLVGQIANLVMAALSFFLQLELTRRIFRSEAAARLGVLLLTLYPNHVAYTSFILTEVYFTFLLLLGVYLYITRSRWLWIWVCGIVFGLAALTKPQAVFLPGLLVLFHVFSAERKDRLRQHLIKGFAIYLAMAMVLVPWAVRNTMIFGELVLISTNGGATLLTGNHPTASGGYEENDPLVAQRNFSVQDQVESDRRAKKLATDWIRENPVRFVELIPLKIWHLWSRNGEAEWAYQAGYRYYEQYSGAFRTMRWINQIFYALLLVGSFAAAFLLIRHPDKVAWPWVLVGYCLMIYLTLISVVFSGQPRFHFPAMPWAIMYAAWAAVMITVNQTRERYDAYVSRTSDF